jgi:hypothetical protein
MLVRQYLSRNRTQIDLKRVINDNPENFRKNLKRNEILMKSLKMSIDFSLCSCYYVPFRAVSKSFGIKIYFFVNTNLNYVDLSLSVCFLTKYGQVGLFAERCREHEFLRYLICHSYGQIRIFKNSNFPFFKNHAPP